MDVPADVSALFQNHRWVGTARRDGQVNKTPIQTATNCKPTYRKPNGFFPFVRLHSHSGQQYPRAEAFEQEIALLYEAREQEHEARRLQSSLSPQRGPRSSNLSLERFRSSPRYRDRPAAADIAFCVAAFAHGTTDDRI